MNVVGGVLADLDSFKFKTAFTDPYRQRLSVKQTSMLHVSAGCMESLFTVFFLLGQCCPF